MSTISIIAFSLFAVVTLTSKSSRSNVKTRSRTDWIVDAASLLIHFFGLPILSGSIVYGLCEWLLSSYRGVIGGGWFSGVLAYVFLDYLWYWNHRIFHADTPLWSLHSTHHKPTHFDVFITARNAVASHFAMVYFWGIGISVYLLKDSNSFLAMAALGGVVNFWSHTEYSLPKGSILEKIVGSIFVLPIDHSWHHSREESRVNFGTFFSVWDRLHGTLHRPGHSPTAFGEEKDVSVWKQLVWPV